MGMKGFLKPGKGKIALALGFFLASVYVLFYDMSKHFCNLLFEGFDPGIYCTLMPHVFGPQNFLSPHIIYLIIADIIASYLISCGLFAWKNSIVRSEAERQLSA